MRITGDALESSDEESSMSSSLGQVGCIDSVNGINTSTPNSLETVIKSATEHLRQPNLKFRW